MFRKQVTELNKGQVFFFFFFYEMIKGQVDEENLKVVQNYGSVMCDC